MSRNRIMVNSRQFVNSWPNGDIIDYEPYLESAVDNIELFQKLLWWPAGEEPPFIRPSVSILEPNLFEWEEDD